MNSDPGSRRRLRRKVLLVPQTNKLPPPSWAPPKSCLPNWRGGSRRRRWERKTWIEVNEVNEVSPTVCK